MKNKQLNFLLAAMVIFIVAGSRIIFADLQWYNFSPVAALGLFAGAIIKDKRFSYLYVLFAYFISDLFFHFFTNTQGFYGVDQYFVYVGMLAVTFLGSKMGQPKALKVFGYTLAGSAIFFIISNFGVWVSIEFGKDLFGYGKGFTGLVNTFVAALPFYHSEAATMLFRNFFVGNLFFSAVFFGFYYIAQQIFLSKLQKAKA